MRLLHIVIGFLKETQIARCLNNKKPADPCNTKE